jgi:ribosomal protection tetracycline resistance protein
MLPKYLKQIERLANIHISNGLRGWEVTDCNIELLNGRYDSVGSEQSHFNVAVPIALFRALKSSGTTLMEPINSFTLTTPADIAEQAQKLLNNNGAKTFGYHNKDDIIRIQGQIPAKASEEVQKSLPRITSGLGKLVCKFSGYQKTNDVADNNFRMLSPENEIFFVQNHMGLNYGLLDKQKVKEHKVKFSQRAQERDRIMGS